MKLSFVSYDGEYPNLCSGRLVLAIDGKETPFPSYCLCSGGSAYFDSEWNDYVEQGEWSISDWPEAFPEELKKRAVELVNENVRQGCCGGCL